MKWSKREHEKHIPQSKRWSKWPFFLPVLAPVLVRNGLIKEGINSLLSQVCLKALSLPTNLAGSMLDLNSCCFLRFIKSARLQAHSFPYSYFTRVSIAAVPKYVILHSSCEDWTSFRHKVSRNLYPSRGYWKTCMIINVLKGPHKTNAGSGIKNR